MNILLILATLEVSNPLTSKDVREEQSWNIEFIFVTLEVSHPLKSKDVKAEQFRNILLIFVTLETSHPFKSKFCIVALSLNKSAKLTFSPLNFQFSAINSVMMLLLIASVNSLGFV